MMYIVHNLSTNIYQLAVKQEKEEKILESFITELEAIKAYMKLSGHKTSNSFQGEYYGLPLRFKRYKKALF